MNINSSRNSLLRARNLRSAKRGRSSKVLSSRLSSNSRTRTNAAKNASAFSSANSKTRQIAMYEKMEKCASDIQSNVDKLLVIGRMTYTDDEKGQEEQKSDREKLISGVKSFVSDFNLVHSALADIGGSSNLAYKKTLDSIVKPNADALKEIGITVTKDGELSIDKKALEGADAGKIKALFAKEGCFAEKISGKMETIETTAASSLTALNKLYGANATYSKYGTGNSYYDSYYNGYYGNNSNWYI